MSTDAPGRPDVFAYLDYRAFLRDYYAFGKAKYGLSHRGLAKRVGVRSPSFLKYVMQGDRNLSPGTARRVAKACMLEGEAARFFGALVKFNQAEEREQRAAAYRELHSFEAYRRVQSLDVARDAYHAHWYHPAIREMAGSPHFQEDPKWIAKTLRPSIKPSEAKAALVRLETLGLLVRDEHGKLVQSRQHVTSGSETGSIHLASFHRAMMNRASASIDAIPPERRDISSLTLAVNSRGLALLKERLQAIRRELLVDDAFTEGDSTEVVQLNFQLFPLTEIMDE